VRICPYFPFSARICLNQHHWLANRMRENGIRFKQSTGCCARAGRCRAAVPASQAMNLVCSTTVCCGRWLRSLFLRRSGRPSTLAPPASAHRAGCMPGRSAYEA
jgi:hypothetical protein